MGGHFCIFLIVSILAIFKTADALRCWECSSFEGDRCADYFNQTDAQRRYGYGMNYPGGTGSNQYSPQTPKVKDCSAPQYYDPSQKIVCMKKVQTINNRKMYTRQCSTMNRDMTMGECPKESNSNQLDYCVTCDDSDYCNGADFPKNTILMSVVTIAALFFRKM